MFIAIKAPQISSQSVSLAAKKVLQYWSHQNKMSTSVESSSMEIDDQQPVRRKIPSSSPLLTSPCGVSPRIPAPASASAPSMTSPIPAPPPLPSIPSSQVVLRASSSAAATNFNEPLRIPPKGSVVNLRPISDASDISSVSSTATTVTGRSVNDILSLAGDVEDDDDRRRESLFSDFEIPSQPTQNVSIHQLMLTSSAISRQQQQQQQQVTNLATGQPQAVVVQQPQPVVAVHQPSGAVKTTALPQQLQQVKIQAQALPAPAKASPPVKPVSLEDKPVKTEVKAEIELMDVDGYDDVLQIVYDDVDVKYDVIQLTEPDVIPPVPPARKQRSADSVGRPAPPTPETETSPEEDKPEKPLPETPSKVPAIFSKFGSKKNAKELEEQKKKEKAEREAEKQREREEKEREKEAKKQEELDKKKKKQRQKSEDENVTSPRQSLFQRLFSKWDDDNFCYGLIG